MQGKSIPFSSAVGLRAGLHDLIPDILRDLHVVAGLHGVLAAALGAGAQVSGVAEHLAQGHQGADGLGAGAGNAQAEVVAGVFQRLGYQTGLDFYGYMDLAENVVEPIMQRPQVIKSAPLMLGYAGVYSSFLLHTYRAAEKFHLNPRDILVELGRRGMVGGQEDMIIDVAHALSLEKTAG